MPSCAYLHDRERWVESKQLWCRYGLARLVVKTLMLLKLMESLVGIPILIDAHSPQVKESLSASEGPTHAGTFHAIFDEMAASAFDDASADRPALSQVVAIAHVG